MKELVLFGVRFLNGEYSEIERELNEGKLMVVPAAPALATIYSDPDYHMALKNSDFAILDSGYLCLILKIFKGINVKKLSGLAFLRMFLENFTRDKTIFLIDPSNDESEANRTYLNSVGIEVADNYYIAPIYPKGEIVDQILLERLCGRKPQYIMINLGGGVQERLGYYLKEKLDYSPSIVCTGAAIAFLTEKQAAISPLVDRLYLGWLARVLSDPGKFLPRYFRAVSLLPMVLRERVEVKR